MVAGADLAISILSSVSKPCFWPDLGCVLRTEQAVQGEVTYVHCKAGRGRSTTLVICYLIREMRMCPQEAYAFVRQKRPQVCLADGQWNAVRQVREALP